MESITTAFTTAVATIKTDTISMIEAALPAGLTIAGIMIAAKLGINFFRSIAN